jgi:hypothetical protein
MSILLLIIGTTLLVAALLVLARQFLSNEAFILALFLVIVSYLGFTGVSNNFFWDDEAQVGFIAKNFVKIGHLTGWDGRNLLSCRNGTLIDNNFRSIDPPLAYLVAALSYKLFGNNTFTARYPFVILGLMTLVFFWTLLKQEFGAFYHAHLYGMALFGLSYSFLLNIRQCRYYALCLFFSVVSYLLFVRCIRKGGVPCFIALGLSLSLLFYSNYLLFACFSGALLVVFAVYHIKHATRSFYWKACLAVIVAGVCTVPYAMHFRIWLRPDIPEQKHLVEKAVLLFWNIRELDYIGYLPVIVVVPLLIYLLRNRNNPSVPSSVAQWTLLVGAYVVFISLLSPQPAPWSGIKGGTADIRYLIICLPFSAGIIGFFLALVHKLIGQIVACILLCIMLCTNALSLRLNKLPVRVLLPSYVREIHKKDITPYEAAVSYLMANAKQDDTVVALPDYANQVLLYYMSDKIKIGGLLTDSSHVPRETLARLNVPLYFNAYHPKWIVSFGMLPDRIRWLSVFSRDGYDYGCEFDSAKGSYSFSADAVLPFYWEDKTRPELPWHTFGPVTAFNPGMEAVYIFKRKDKNDDTLGETVSSRHGKAFE